MISTLAPSLVVAIAVVTQFEVEEVPVLIHLEQNVCSKKYVTSFLVDKEHVAPKWDEDEDNPPVSARKAMKLAKKARDSDVSIPDGFRWTLWTLELRPAAGGWFWVVSYRAVSANDQDKEPSVIAIPVMMDETVIHPMPADETEPDRRTD